MCSCVGPQRRNVEIGPAINKPTVLEPRAKMATQAVIHAPTVQAPQSHRDRDAPSQNLGSAKYSGVVNYNGQQARAADLSPDNPGGSAILRHLVRKDGL